LNGKHETQEATEIPSHSEIDGRWEVHQDAVNDFDEGPAKTETGQGKQSPDRSQVYSEWRLGVVAR